MRIRHAGIDLAPLRLSQGGRAWSRSAWRLTPSRLMPARFDIAQQLHQRHQLRIRKRVAPVAMVDQSIAIERALKPMT